MRHTCGTEILHEIDLKFILRKLFMRSCYCDGLWAGRPGFDSPQEQEIFPFSRFKTGSEANQIGT